jgi:RNA polymerase sigma-70 factor, ECF subfamily
MNIRAYTDEQLLGLLKNSGQQAFAEIYHRYWEPLSLYALKITRSQEDARDIVQDVFTSIWKRRVELEVNSSLPAYLFRSVRNLCLRYMENNLKRYNFLQDLPVAFSGIDKLTPEQELELKQYTEQLAAAVDEMPEKMQQVFRLSREEGLSQREIAEQLNIAETTVKKQVQNALRFIRKQAGSFFLVLVQLFPRIF